MRTLASLEHYVVLSSADEVRRAPVHPGHLHRRRSAAARPRCGSRRSTRGKEGSGSVVESAPGGVWGLAVRVPHWAAERHARGQRRAGRRASRSEGWLTVRGSGREGDELVLDLPLDVRFTRADPGSTPPAAASRWSAGRWSTAWRRSTTPASGWTTWSSTRGARRWSRSDPSSWAAWPPSACKGAAETRPSSSWWPYAAEDAGGDGGTLPTVSRTLTAVPYFAWGNRSEGAMRVWIPTE